MKNFRHQNPINKNLGLNNSVSKYRIEDDFLSIHKVFVKITLYKIFSKIFLIKQNNINGKYLITK